MEIWRKTIESNNYSVSSMGRIRNDITHKIRKQQIDSSGYPKLNFSGKQISVHRVVAKAFLPNPNKKPFINHINGIKNDNRVENLEWCTPKENTTHAINKLGWVTPLSGKKGKNSKFSKPIIQIDVNGNFINKFNGHHEASRITGISRYGISSCAQGKNASCHGTIWINETDYSSDEINKRIIQYMESLMSGKSVIQLTKDGTFINEYYSQSEASRQTGIHSQNISNACNGIYKTAGGYMWIFKNNCNKT